LNRFYYVLFGGMMAFAWGIWFLDWLGRRQERRRKDANR
jgi:hypothetical protein